MTTPPTAVDVLSLLADGDLILEGRLLVASNVTLLGHVERGEQRIRCVYKPVAGERPLWDFPDGTLAAREVAAYLVSEAAAWAVVPPTVLRTDGPMGAGMCQAWIDQPDPPAPWVAVVAPDEVTAEMLPILSAEDEGGDPVVVVHAGVAELRAMALFDAVINNADRKGGHVLSGEPAAVGENVPIVGVDHGVSFHVEPKLRTVLWGWAGEPLSERERERLTGLHASLAGDLGRRLEALLSAEEIAATGARVEALLEAGRMPEPRGRMPVPWPVF